MRGPKQSEIAWGIGTAITLLFAISNVASAAQIEESGSLLNYAGVNLGVGFFNKGEGTQPSLGIEAGTQALTHIGLGGFLGYSPLETLNNDYTSTTYTIAVVGSYFLDILLPGARVGMKTGLSYSRFSSTIDALSPSSSIHFVFGPLVGYDYSLGNGFSLGGEASALIATSNPLGNSVHLLASVRYWF